jgi:hypothetical protein
MEGEQGQLPPFHRFGSTERAFSLWEVFSAIGALKSKLVSDLFRSASIPRHFPSFLRWTTPNQEFVYAPLDRPEK